jgi:hypothetical protein
MHLIDPSQKDRSKIKASCFSRIKSLSGCLFGTKSVNDTVAHFDSVDTVATGSQGLHKCAMPHVDAVRVVFEVQFCRLQLPNLT